MDLNLSDKIVLVAGSSRGIGFATARAFLAEGSRVAITGRTPESLHAAEVALAAEFGAERVCACVCDLTRPAAIVETAATIHSRWGDVECLVANIGCGTARGGWALEEQDWHSVFEENLWASRRLAEAMLPAMTRIRQGSIIFVASIVGLESMNAPISYSAAKAALVSYSKNLAREVAAEGVRVNCVAPGNILFPGGSWEKKVDERPGPVRDYIETEVPLRRFGTAEEIADLIVFLSSARASFVAGACLVADGGQTRGYS